MISNKTIYEKDLAPNIWLPYSRSKKEIKMNLRIIIKSKHFKILAKNWNRVDFPIPTRQNSRLAFSSWISFTDRNEYFHIITMERKARYFDDTCVRIATESLVTENNYYKCPQFSQREFSKTTITDNLSIQLKILLNTKGLSCSLVVFKIFQPILKYY